MENIYQTLLKTADDFKATKKGDNEPKKAAGKKAIPFHQLKGPLIEATKLGQVEVVKKMVEDHPHITRTEYWQNRLARVALDHGQVEMMEYLLEAGSKLEPRHTYDNPFLGVITQHNEAMFKVVWERGLVKWEDMTGRRPYLITSVAGAVGMAKLVADKFGADLGFDLAITKEQPGGGARVVDERERRNHEYIAQSLLAAMIRLTVENPGEFPREKTMTELRKKHLVRAYPGIEGKANLDIWEREIIWDRPENLKVYIEQGIMPEIHGLIHLWYLAASEGKNNSVRWLSSSPRLLKLIKDLWPNWPKPKDEHGQIIQNWRGGWDYTLESIQTLCGLGMDLTAKNFQGTPWIFGKVDPANNVLAWLAKHHPEVFECQNENGKTWVETMGASKRSAAALAQLRSGLISREKPLRQKKGVGSKVRL